MDAPELSRRIIRCAASVQLAALFPVLLAAATATAAVPPAPDKPVKKIRWTPFMLSAYPDHIMLPRARTVYGLELSIGASGAENARGFQIAAIRARAKDVNGFQIGVVRAEGKSVDGFQVAALPMANKLRGFQIGLVNNFELTDTKERAHICGIQISGMNAATRMKGLQLGIVNDGGQLRGAQLGALNYSGDAKAFQLGGVNIVGLNAEQGSRAKAFQIGAINLATENFKGVQIGVFNSVNRLKGVQIGLLNYVHHPKRKRWKYVPLLNISTGR